VPSQTIPISATPQQIRVWQVGEDLLVGAAALFDASLLQSEVVLEQEREEMPHDADLVQLGLERGIHRKRTDAFGCHATQFGEVLEKKVATTLFVFVIVDVWHGSEAKRNYLVFTLLLI